MENAAEALKIAFGVIMFVVALTLSISSFSQAKIAVEEITYMSDRENEYTYVKPSSELIRTVGVETIVPTMYRAYTENIEIYFYKKNADGTTEPLIVYYETDQVGRRKKDENGKDIGRNYIDLVREGFGTEGIKLATEVANEHLDVILADLSDESILSDGYKELKKKYLNQFNIEKYPKGFYNYIKGKTFEERLGEYKQGTGANEIIKRVITYTLID